MYGASSKKQSERSQQKSDPPLSRRACWLFDRTVYHTAGWLLIASDCSVFIRSGCMGVHVCVCVCVCVLWGFSAIFLGGREEKNNKCCACCGFFRKLLSHTRRLEPRPGDRDRVWLPKPLLHPLGPQRPGSLGELVCIFTMLQAFGGDKARHNLDVSVRV